MARRQGEGGGLALLLYGGLAFLLYRVASGGGAPAATAVPAPPAGSQGVYPGTKLLYGVGRPGPNQSYWVNDAGYVTLSDGPPDIAGNWSPAGAADLQAAGIQS